MMEYIEVIISGVSEENAGILTAEMCEFGFDSFTEENGGVFSAYIPLESFDIMPIANFLEQKSANLGFTYKVEKIASRNWNQEWESSYQPVRIGSCYIRAPFHEMDPGAETELIIEPKMSFGTAHHETTRLMIETMLTLSFGGCAVLDMGTGTGVLGILAAKLGAKPVVAIDNDEWSFLNAKENALRNNVDGILVIQGDAADIPAGKYRFVFANINRNVLLRDIPLYNRYLEVEGELILSGFYEEDLDIITEKTAGLGLVMVSRVALNHWVAIRFKKC
jgi:ribosomal protein L11 methyltransferase